MPIVKDIIPSGVPASIIKEAQNKREQLVKDREMMAVPSLVKSYRVNGYFIKVEVSDHVEKLTIIGGSGPEIVLLSDNNVGLYSYSKDMLSKVSNSIGATRLSQLFDRMLLFSEKVLKVVRVPRIKAFEGSIQETSTALPLINKSYEVKNNGLTCIDLDTEGNIQEQTWLLPAEDCTWLDGVSNNGNKLLVNSQLLEKPHTLFNSQLMWMYIPKTGHMLPYFKWYPQIHWGGGHIHTGFGLWGQGFVYGTVDGYKTGTITDDGFKASRYMEVTFGSHLQQLSTRPYIGKYGYCEVLKRTDDSFRCVLCFYIYPSPISMQSNSGFGNVGPLMEEYRGSTIQSIPNIGSVDLFNYFGSVEEDIAIHWWNSKTAEPNQFSTAPDPLRDRYGVVACRGNTIVVMRGVSQITTKEKIVGAFGVIYESFNYIDHSVSTDGRFVSIFTGVENVIEETTVIDLECWAEVKYEDRAKSGKNSWEFVRKEVLTNDGFGFTTADFIPYSNDVMTDKKAILQTFDSVELQITGKYDSSFETAYGGTWTGYRKTDPDWWWKVVCEDGIHASTVLAHDKCRTGEVVGLSCSSKYCEDEITITVDGTSCSGTFNTIELPFMYYKELYWNSKLGKYCVGLIYLSKWVEDDEFGVKPYPPKVSAPDKIGISKVDHNIKITGIVGCGKGLYVSGNPLGEYSYDDVWSWEGDSSWSIEPDNCGGLAGHKTYYANGVMLIKATERCDTFEGGTLKAETVCGQVAEIVYEPKNPPSPFITEKTNEDENGVFKYGRVYGGQKPYFVSIDGEEPISMQSCDSSGCLPTSSWKISSSACDPHTYQFFDSCGRTDETVYEELIEIGISGPEAAQIGSRYEVHNADNNHTEFSISCGEIDSTTGVITETVCGSAVVSVSCSGSTASMDVRFPEGRWVYVSRETNPSNQSSSYRYWCACYSIPGGCADAISIDRGRKLYLSKIFGKYATLLNCIYVRGYPSEISDCNWVPSLPHAKEHCSKNICWHGWNSGPAVAIHGECRLYEWRC